MNKTIVFLAVLPLCVSLLCSCASTPQNAGPTQTVQESWGTKNIYKDASGRTLWIAKYGPDNYLIPGACIVQYIYDTNGVRVAKQNLGLDRQLICNKEGYAITKYAYPADSAGQPVVEERFFDTNDQPVVTKSGFAMMTCTENPDGRVDIAHFSDFLSKPAPSVWFGVSNVVDVQYFYLQGVTPIVCGIFWNANGDLLDRKQLKGLTTQVTIDPSDDDDFDVPVHIHVGGSHNDGGGFHGHR